MCQIPGVRLSRLFLFICCLERCYLAPTAIPAYCPCLPGRPSLTTRPLPLLAGPMCSPPSLCSPWISPLPPILPNFQGCAQGPTSPWDIWQLEGPPVFLNSSVFLKYYLSHIFFNWDTIHIPWIHPLTMYMWCFQVYLEVHLPPWPRIPNFHHIFDPPSRPPGISIFTWMSSLPMKHEGLSRQDTSAWGDTWRLRKAEAGMLRTADNSSRNKDQTPEGTPKM